MTSVKTASILMALGLLAAFGMSPVCAQNDDTAQPAVSEAIVSEPDATAQAVPAPDSVEAGAAAEPVAIVPEPDAAAKGVDSPAAAVAPGTEAKSAETVASVTVEEPKVVFKHSSLHQAAYNGDLADVRKFIEAGADVNAVDKDSIKSSHWSGLTSHWAAKIGPTATAALWDANRAEVGLMGSTGDRPLHRATYGENSEVVELLLENGADVNAKNEKGLTALHVAALCGNTSVLKILIGKGADVNARDNEDVTPLHMAAESGAFDVTKLLLLSMADVNAQDKQGITPLHWAVFGAHDRVAKLLLSRGAKLNVRDTDGRTPKRWAAIQLLRVTGHGDLCNSLALRGGIE